MPKPKFNVAINLNLLKPQSNLEKLPVKLIRWLLSSGRYLFAIVNALILIAFITRFKLDADLASKKEAISEQIPYIESLKPYEILIRETQLKLSTIGSVKTSSLDWSVTLKKIADATPTSVKIITINIGKDVGGATIHISGQTPINSDLGNFMTGLKAEESFTEVNIANIGLEQGIIKFTIDTRAKLVSSGGKNI